MSVDRARNPDAIAPRSRRAPRSATRVTMCARCDATRARTIAGAARERRAMRDRRRDGDAIEIDRRAH